jgi:hypothetical protein
MVGEVCRVVTEASEVGAVSGRACVGWTSNGDRRVAEDHVHERYMKGKRALIRIAVCGEFQIQE